MSKLTLNKIIKNIEAKVEYLEAHVVAKVDLADEIQELKNYAAGLDGTVAEVPAPKTVDEVPITIADAPPETADEKKAFGK